MAGELFAASVSQGWTVPEFSSRAPCSDQLSPKRKGKRLQTTSHRTSETSPSTHPSCSLNPLEMLYYLGLWSSERGGDGGCGKDTHTHRQMREEGSNLKGLQHTHTHTLPHTLSSEISLQPPQQEPFREGQSGAEKNTFTGSHVEFMLSSQHLISPRRWVLFVCVCVCVIFRMSIKCLKGPLSSLLLLILLLFPPCAALLLSPHSLEVR